MKERLFLIGALVLIGALWGATLPMSKIAVSTGHQPFGLIFWQSVLITGLLALVNWLRGKSLPWRPVQIRLYVIIGLVGTILSNGASYMAAVHLPAGVISILLSTVPMMAFPIALALGLDRFNWLRAGGLLCGLIGVILLIGPDAALPDKAMVPFVLLTLFAAFCYGLESNLVALWKNSGVDPVQILLGASIVVLILSLFLALGMGQWIDPTQPWGRPEMALVASSLIHGLVYTSYVWLVGRAGPVFAVQVSYLVTGFGVVWSMVLLGERYTSSIWAALILMVIGIFLVLPRYSNPLAPEAALRKNAAKQ